MPRMIDHGGRARRRRGGGAGRKRRKSSAPGHKIAGRKSQVRVTRDL